MSTCSRCGCQSPNPSCFVCAEPEEEPDTYPDEDNDLKDSYLERLLDRADYLRTKRKDEAWEDAQEARGDQDEEEHKLGLDP